MSELRFERFDHPRYKYRLTKSYHHALHNVPDSAKASIDDPSGDECWVRMDGNYLFLREGYAWNGPDVVRDRKDLMRASLVHDAGYQLIAGGHIPKKPWKRHFDNAFARIARADGLPWFLVAVVWAAVRVGGGATTKYITEE